MQRRHFVIVTIAVAFGMLGQAHADEKPRFVVIINASTKVTDVSAAELRAMYAKMVTRWKDDTAVIPLDLLLDAPVRETFSETVLEKTPRAVQMEWRQRLFAGQGTPPREVRDDVTMVATIAATPGAIGYIAAATPLPPTVRILNVK